MKYANRIAVLLSLVLILMLASCEQTAPSQSDTPSPMDDVVETTEATEEVVISDGYEKFSQIKIGMTESEVNAIMGEPSSVDKARYYYTITVSGQPMEAEIWINMESGLVTYTYAPFYKNEYRAQFHDDATDLSRASDLENQTIATYDDCVTAFGTSGNIMGLEENGNTTYLWADGTGGYIQITFRSDGTIKSYSGVC